MKKKSINEADVPRALGENEEKKRLCKYCGDFLSHYPCFCESILNDYLFSCKIDSPTRDENKHNCHHKFVNHISGSMICTECLTIRIKQIGN